MKHPKNPEKPVANVEVACRPGDKFFFFTDRITDQIWGPCGLSYVSLRVRKELLENPGNTLPQFNAHFRKDFAAWMGRKRQLDALLLIGIKL